jgi:hypothetical protein
MHKKLTIAVEEEVYAGLHKVIVPKEIIRFVQEIVRPYVVRPDYESAYAEMAKDKKRENEALVWAEMNIKDVDHEAMCNLVMLFTEKAMYDTGFVLDG